MRRRQFIGAAAWPLTLRAQQLGRIYRIGILEPIPAARNAANLNALRKGLRELGYTEERNLVIEYRSADGRAERFPDLASELVRLNVVEDFLAGDDEVLLLFAPPGSAKSTWLSILFPSYYLARFPSNSILAATHSVEFAQRWGRRVRNDIMLDSRVLGLELSLIALATAELRWGAACMSPC